MTNGFLKKIEEDVTNTVAVIEALNEYADGREFKVADVPNNDRYLIKVPYEWGGRQYMRKSSISGSAMVALCNRGVARVVRKEKDYVCIGENYKGQPIYINVNVNVYRVTQSAEEYKRNILLEIADTLLMDV